MMDLIMTVMVHWIVLQVVIQAVTVQQDSVDIFGTILMKMVFRMQMNLHIRGQLLLP